MHEFQAFKKNEALLIQSFIQVPRELMDSEEYISLTPDAILLYSLLADRLALSFQQNEKNSKIKYYDEKGNMYVIFKRDEALQKLHLKRAKLDSAIKLLKDVNLIQEKKQGKNLPNIIYVGKTKSMIESAKVIKIGTAENKQSGVSNLYNPDCRKSALHNSQNYINKNNIYNSQAKGKNFLKQKYENESYNTLNFADFYAN
ncbi:MAG: replication initiator protein A [Clostridia bacterium]|nr:replication initiator protein A [Clostridia bacterium]